MRTNNSTGLLFCTVALCAATSTLAQNDGDQPVTNGSGQTYLATDAQVGGGSTQPVSFTVGTAGSSASSLVVDGSSFSTQTGEVFRTIGKSADFTYWRMFRNTDQIGRLWHTNPSFSFHVQAIQAADYVNSIGSGLFLLNENDDGIKINHNGVLFSSNTLNGYTLDRQGFTALGAGPNGWNALNPNGPWSRLHLTHENQGAGAPNGGYRPWMRNGITGTGNSDLFYIGHKYEMSGGTGAEVDDNSDLVAAWYDDELPEGTSQAYNNFSFRYLGDLTLGGSAGTIEGLEMMRLRPYRLNANDDIEGFVGIGDWVNTTDMPEERLDVLDRTIRARAIPASYNDDDLDKVLVIDDDGRFWWRDAATLAGTPVTDCDWSVPTGATGNHVSTAFGANTANCPDDAEAVGIGINLGVTSPQAKLTTVTDDFNQGVRIEQSMDNDYVFGEVITTTGGTAENYGEYILNTAADGTDRNWGVVVGVSGESTRSRGVYVESDGGYYSDWAGQFTALGNNSPRYCTGVAAVAQGGVSQSFGVTGSTRATASENAGVYGSTATAGTSNTGVHGLAGSPSTLPAANIGVFAENNGTGTADFALYVRGAVRINGSAMVVSGGTWTTSDEQLKTNVQPITDALDMVAQLAPKTYEFDQSVAPAMDLPSGMQSGFLAQELEGVLPGVVQEFTLPAQVDTMGTEVAPAFPYKAVNYASIIPYLVGAVQELKEQNDALQAQIQNCCAQGGGMAPEGNDRHSSTSAPSNLQEERLLISPNPFTTSTTISYYMPNDGRVKLEVSDANGRALNVLREEETNTGEHSYEWNTQSLAAGTYFVAFSVNGQVVVKRAVKVNDR